jgi:ADP-dependent NAD(P)H-hydrate dehydratase / NAD(P)H-hydrate epimerase
MAFKENKIISANDMKALDQKTMSVYGIPGIILMENAGSAVADATIAVLVKGYPGEDILLKHILVVAGGGNNGGDGFVAARHLHNRGFNVKILLVGEVAQLKGDALVNWGIITSMNLHAYQVSSVSPEQVRALIDGCDCIIDAIFGIGLDKEVTGMTRRFIQQINERGVPVIAVDIPSGLNADTGEERGIAVKAHTTVTMGAIKSGLMADHAKTLVGEIIVADISIPRELL